MRLFAIVVIGLVSGCSQSTAEPVRTDSAASPSPEPANTQLHPQPVGLYTDEEIRKLAQFDIDQEADDFGFPFDAHVLDVVPAGESYPREKVFKRLNIDDKRIRDFRQIGADFVVFLIWQVSPSYDITCMTAINAAINNRLEMTDSKRHVYGIRFVKRPK